ncbi:MAG: alpha-L-fucosidase [Lachnospiraceae bacterium]|nr:alpha-L-fucosidase [Lachnospiraceae bacterium]
MNADKENILKSKDAELIKVVPTQRQLLHQQMEFYAFVHFTVNTFTGREWGDGTESPEIFNPTEFDADQWVNAIQEAGMSGLILTCKHHDGFCLWPSKYTKHTIEYSPFRNGKGDIVGDVAKACKKAGIAFGVYLSPWDRNSALYGKGREYDDFFIHQLEELLTQYGEIFAVWFDGACGEGPNGKKQYYDWDRYYETIRRLQPNANISVCGPDVRWCGNEAGHTRQSEWSVVPKRTADTEKIAAASQHTDDNRFRERKISASDEDLGSREVLKDEKEFIWYPAEVNTSIRPGWFYHDFEDDKVKPLKELIYVYEHSVGGNATFLLNIPPSPKGLLHQNDVARLRQLGDYLRLEYADNKISDKWGVTICADYSEAGHGAENVKCDDYGTYFKTGDGQRECTLTFTWPEEIRAGHLVLKENILLSQRVESFEVIAAGNDGREEIIGRGTVIGYKKIVSFGERSIKTLKVKITDSRVSPTLSFAGLY